MLTWPRHSHAGAPFSGFSSVQGRRRSPDVPGKSPFVTLALPECYKCYDRHQLYTREGVVKVVFHERFRLPVDYLYSFFRSPRDWPRLYGLVGDVQDRGDGWVAVPLKSFPFPLVARNTDAVPNELVRWTFRGFWRGEGEVRFYRDGEFTVLDGYERISIRWLGGLSAFVERLFLQRAFESIWNLGWRRLHKAENKA